MARAHDPAPAAPEPTDAEEGTGTRGLSPDEQQLEKADADQRLLAQIWGGLRQAEREAPAAPAPTPARRFVRTGTRLSEPPSNAARSRHSIRIDELRRQLAERIDEHGPRGAETLAARLALAQAHIDDGQAAAAIPLLEQAIADYTPTQTEQAATLIPAARGALGRAYLATRQPQRAIAVYETLLAGESSASPRRELLGYRIKLAVAHRASGNVATAVDHLQALSTELEGERAGRDSLLEARIELATTNVVAGRPRDGASLYETAVPLATELHGAEHRTTLGVRLMLARAHQQAGRRADALRLYEQLASDAERALGASDRLTRQAHSELITSRLAH